MTSARRVGSAEKALTCTAISWRSGMLSALRRSGRLIVSSITPSTDLSISTSLIVLISSTESALHLARDNDLLDLGGALVDAQEAHVAIETLHLVFRHVARPA